MPVTVWAVPLLVFLMAACGEDDGQGGTPDIFLGLSGVIIAILVGWFLLRAFSRRR